MAIEDYLAALFGGQTGTDDPARAGWSFPSLIGSAQAAEPSRPTPGYLSPESGAMPAPPPIPGPMELPPAASPSAPYVPPGLQFLRMMQNHDYSMPPLPGPPPIPGPLSPPPPIPDAMSPGGPPQAPGPQMQPGGAKILARLYNPEPIQAPGGDDISRIVNMIGPQSGPYAALQQTARNAQMAGQQPAAAPIPQPPTAAAPAPMTMQQQPPQQQGGIGANIQSHISELKSNPDFQRVLPPSTKPGFYDNLLRFGLAAMAAGGKPGSNTLGALGEAGLSTFDNNQKAGQADFENAIAARKLGIGAQDQISKAYERLDGLKQRSEDTRLSIDQRREAAQERAAGAASLQQIQLMIAQGRHEEATARLEQMQRENASKDADRADKTEDRRTAEARHRDDLGRQTERDANQAFAKSFGEIQKDMNSVGLSLDQKQFRARQEAAYGNPGSNQDQIYQQKAAQLRAQAQAAIAAGKPKAQVNKMLQDYGLEVLP